MISRRMMPSALVVAFATVACIPTLGEDAAAVRIPEADPMARAGGTLTIAVPPPDGIDPGNVNEPSGALIVGTFCDALVAFDPATGEPRPGLAESWTVTRGGRKLFVRLRPGARFHNGREVTAEDVAYTLSRVASQEYASRAAHLLAPIAGYGFVHGELDTDNPRLRRELLGVAAADRRTVEITLDEPHADFVRVLGHPSTSPVPREEVDADAAAFARQPVCAGPYRVAEPWEPGRVVRLERFEGYNGSNTAFTGGGAGYAEEIRFVVRPSRAAEARAFRRGRADVARAPLGADGPNVERGPGGRIEFVGLPTSVAPFDDPLVRRALSLALDRAGIAERTRRIPARAFLPPGIASEPCPTLPARADPVGARDLLARAATDLAGTEIPFTFNDLPVNWRLAEEVGLAWARTFGARVRFETMDYEEFLALGRSRDGFGGAFRFGWEGAYPGPEPALAPLFRSAGIGIDNLSRYSSAAFADTLDAARRVLDDAERADAYARVHQVLCAELPMLPVTVDERAFFVRGARVGSAIGRYLDAAAGDPIVRELFVR